MKTKKRKKEEPFIKSMIFDYLNILSLRCNYYKNAVEIDKELQESVITIKRLQEDLDLYKNKYKLLKKDHKALMEVIENGKKNATIKPITRTKAKNK